jgi:hypothetical protein
MSSKKSPDIKFMSDAPRRKADIGALSDKGPPAENAALSELSLVLLDHMPAAEVRSVIDQLAVLSADYRAGKLSESHFDRVAEQVIGTALARNRRAVAA